MSSQSLVQNGVGNAVVGVGALTAHPRNYNQHSAGQVGDLRRSLRRFGQVRSIVVQAQADGAHHLIVAGHGIVTAARAEGIESLRADVIPADWDDAMVLAYLAADNELARQGEPDEAQLAALLRDVQATADRELAALAAGSEARLTEMLATLDGGAAGDAEAQVDRAAELQRWEVPDALWPTNNDWGIPLLDKGLQATALVAPVVPWGMGAGARSRKHGGTWHFYTEDYRFDALWVDPSPVVNSGCAAIVEPNFSVYLDMPAAVALWAIYRKRWIARWLQSFGVRVFVDLNVAETHADLNLLGVPREWAAWATRGYTERMDATVREYERAVKHAGTESILFLVYGGGKKVQELCQERGWLWVMEQRDAAKGVNDGEGER